jgi:hypothetical protein
MNDRPTTEQRAALLLKEAAAAAVLQPSLRKAIDCAWGWLHKEGPEVMTVAFRLWCAAEGHSGWPGNLGGILTRRYRSASDISTSLETASESAEHGGVDG